MRRRFDSSFGIIVYRQKLLLLLRDDYAHIPCPTSWSFVGGVPEKGETPKTTFLREAKEEANIESTNVRFVRVFFLVKRKKFVYCCRRTGREKRSIHLGDEGKRL